MLENNHYNHVVHGASITGAEGGGIVVVDLNNSLHFVINALNAKGAVAQDEEHRFQRMSLTDRKEEGVEVLRGVSDNPHLKPGEKLVVQVGTHSLTIEGTDKPGVTLNGKKAVKWTEKLERNHYPL